MVSKKPLNVYSLIPQNSGASHYYRLTVPLTTAHALGLNIRTIIDKNDANMPVEERVRSYCDADVVALYQPIGEGPVNNIRGINGFLPSKVEGHWKYPPSVVIETDDNLFNVSPLNNAFKSLGIRDLNGELIPPGHHIGVVEQGERKVLWRDGEDGFSIPRNRATLASFRTILQLADAVQCSTPAVEKALRKEVTPQRTRVFPNLVRLDHYEQVDLKDDSGKVKILWQGGIAHYEDWYPLKDALGRITAKYPHVEWVIWGAQFPWVHDAIPAHRMTFKAWCPYAEYKLRLAMIGHDISLAPLSPNVFNDCRSAIKFYESSVLKKPAATLAQNSAAYKAEIVDGETALLFNDPAEFEAKLSLLIEDATERKRLAANAKDWVSENRDAMKKVPAMVAFWEMLRDEKKLEMPRVTDEHWSEIAAQDEAEQRAEQEALNGTVPG